MNSLSDWRNLVRPDERETAVILRGRKAALLDAAMWTAAGAATLAITSVPAFLAICLAKWVGIL